MQEENKRKKQEKIQREVNQPSRLKEISEDLKKVKL